MNGQGAGALRLTGPGWGEVLVRGKGREGERIEGSVGGVQRVWIRFRVVKHQSDQIPHACM